MQRALKPRVGRKIEHFDTPHVLRAQPLHISFRRRKIINEQLHRFAGNGRYGRSHRFYIQFWNTHPEQEVSSVRRSVALLLCGDENRPLGRSRLHFGLNFHAFQLNRLHIGGKRIGRFGSHSRQSEGHHHD